MDDTLCPVCSTPLTRLDGGDWLCTADPEDPQRMTAAQLERSRRAQELVAQVAAGAIPLSKAITCLSEEGQ